MADRYFVTTPIALGRATVEGAEAHHLLHVMRARPGLRVTLFDGGGAEFPAVVERLGRTTVELQVSERVEADRELPRAVTLGVALPKGERQRWLIEKLVEFGVTQVVPLATQRGVAQPVEQALDRLRRTVIEASKQCGRNRLMTIAPPRPWSEFVAAAPVQAVRRVAHPSQIEPTGLRFDFVGGDEPIWLGIGPEGGFTDEEIAQARAAGWRTVDLGKRILRVETAALFLAAAVVAQLPAEDNVGQGLP